MTELDALAESHPQYWVAHTHPHWDVAKNQRFRVYRLDGTTDGAGHWDGAVWDADERRWREQRLGIVRRDLKRLAEPSEIPQEVLL